MLTLFTSLKNLLALQSPESPTTGHNTNLMPYTVPILTRLVFAPWLSTVMPRAPIPPVSLQQAVIHLAFMALAKQRVRPFLTSPAPSNHTRVVRAKFPASLPGSLLGTVPSCTVMDPAEGRGLHVFAEVGQPSTTFGLASLMAETVPRAGVAAFRG